MFTELEDNAVWLCPIDKLDFNKWKVLNRNPNLHSSDGLNKTFKEITGETGGLESIIEKLDFIHADLKSMEELKLMLIECNAKIDSSLTPSALPIIRQKTSSKRKSSRVQQLASRLTGVNPVIAVNSAAPTDPAIHLPTTADDPSSFAAVVSRPPPLTMGTNDPAVCTTWSDGGALGTNSGSLLKVVRPPKVIFFIKVIIWNRCFRNTGLHRGSWY